MVLFATKAIQKTQCSHTMCLQPYSWPLRVTVMPTAYHSHSYTIRVKTQNVPTTVTNKL